MNLRKFIVPEVVFGNGAFNMCGSYLRKLGCKRPLVVTDNGVRRAGWADKISQILDEYHLEYAFFDDVSPNPRDYEVMNGAKVYQEFNADSLLSIGGGSAMDCAKGIGIVVTNGREINDFAGVDLILKPVPPMIFIPTTAGTSSDVSQFSIILDTVKRTKFAIISKSIIPDVSLIDPITLTTVDKYLSACTGIDALVHAIEAFVSSASSPMTDLNSLNAIELIYKNLQNSLNTPDNEYYRDQMMLASFQAGMAFSNASLGAVHATAHSLGGYLDLAHGECNALMLPESIKINFDHSVERYRRIAQIFGLDLKISGLSFKNQFIEKIKLFINESGIEFGLNKRGVKKSDVKALSERAYEDPCLATNPFYPSIRDIEVMYEEAL